MREHKKPAPMVTTERSNDPNWMYVQPTCPACGKYPGGEGWLVCQYCDRWVEAHGTWWKKKKGWFW